MGRRSAPGPAPTQGRSRSQWSRSGAMSLPLSLVLLKVLDTTLPIAHRGGITRLSNIPAQMSKSFYKQEVCGHEILSLQLLHCHENLHKPFFTWDYFPTSIVLIDHMQVFTFR